MNLPDKEKAPLPEVRWAVPDDEPAILEMTTRLHEENGLFSLNPDKVRACLKRYFKSEYVVVGVIGEIGKLEASTCLTLSDFYYTDDEHLAELWNFVEAPYRQSRNAEALVRFGMACADHMKMPLFTGIITNKRMSGKVRLYRQFLGAPAGAFFLYNGRWKSEPISDNSDLCERLAQASQLCASNKVSTRSDLVEISKLLSEARKQIKAADNIWGGVPKVAAT